VLLLGEWQVVTRPSFAGTAGIFWAQQPEVTGRSSQKLLGSKVGRYLTTIETCFTYVCSYI